MGLIGNISFVQLSFQNLEPDFDSGQQQMTFASILKKKKKNI